MRTNLAVDEANAPLAVEPIPSQTALAGSTLTVPVTANDSAPGRALTYGLDPGAPSGAMMDPNSGILTWNVPTSETPGDYPVTVRVTDNGSPALSVTTSFTVTVGLIQQPTSFSSVSGAGVYNGTATLTVTLTSGGSPLAGKIVAFTLNNGGTVTNVGTATTDQNGVAMLTGVSLAGFNAGTDSSVVGVNFAGDSTDQAVNGSGDLTVNPAQATLSLSGLSFSYDGSAHAATVSSDPAGLGGVTVSYALNNVAVAAPTRAGSYTVTAALNNPNYMAASVTGTLVIHQATPTITWPRPADITSGTPLESAQLDASASVPGTFSYSPAAGTVLNPGQRQLLAVIFTPSDTTDYTTASGSTLINVLSAPPPPTPPQATGIVGAGHSKKGLTSITVAFDEALDSVSVDNLVLYSVLGAVKKHKKTVYSKVVPVKGASYDNSAHRVTITLAKPYKGAVQVTVHAGISAANGAKSTSDFTAVTR